MKKKVLMVGNSDIVIYNFRKELVIKLLGEGYEVIVSSPYGPGIDKLVEMGCSFEEIDLDRHGTNPIKELKLIGTYQRLIIKTKPDAVLTYTIKPSIYAGFSSRLLKVPYITTITGLGGALQTETLMTKVLRFMYKVSLKKARVVFMQNSDNYDYFNNHNIAKNKLKLVNGSGVNLDEFNFSDYPTQNEETHLLYIGRVMKEKGIDELLTAAKKISESEKNIAFDIIGFIDGPYEEIIHDYHSKGIIRYHGMQSDVKPFIRNASAILLPSYHEGVPNSLLEAAAMGRPLIASDIPGCREVILDRENGYLHLPRNSDDLVMKIQDFIHLSIDQKTMMGKKSRKHVERFFDRNDIVNIYFSEIEKIK